MGFFDTFRSQEPANAEPVSPVRFEDGSIHVNSESLREWWKREDRPPQYEARAALRLIGSAPVIVLYEDDEQTREYALQPEEGECFDGRYFHVSVRLGFMGMPPVGVAQIDGFVSDTAEEREMTGDDIGYRMEGHFLRCSGAFARERSEAARGKDLMAKGLKYPGYTTPSNVRLVGVCADCSKSFAFHGYAVYMAQEDVAYSDDGLDVCAIPAYDIDPDTWSFEAGAKTFRYYNSFRCPHCGAAYIDYENNRDMKVFGVSACALLGHEVVRVPPVG